MKILERNKQTFYYATYSGTSMGYDEDGFMTFENAAGYSKWQKFRANISPARGESTAELFGNDTDYDKVIVTDNLNCPIDENSVLAIDMTVEEDTDVTTYDYIVKKVAKSLNFIQYAVKKVKVNESISESNGN